MKNYPQKHRRVTGFLGALAALSVATIYYFVVPEETAQAGGAQEIILRYGHTICWIFLATASVFWGFGGPKRLISIFAYMALLSYVIFIGTLLVVKYL